MRHFKFVFVIAFAAITTTLLLGMPIAAAHAGHHGDGDLARVRLATVRYHDLAVAKANGYGLFTDAAGIACIANPPAGAMGIHYVNGGLVSGGKINALKPQALVYEPGNNGEVHLVAVEYIAFKQAWDATHESPPMLFGQGFMLTTTPNRYGLPAFYSLHAWIWKSNPSGMFAMWNPEVHCGADTPKNASPNAA
ncbi:MAG TPA: hypothetical protein VJN88_01470 [Ktedonobacterales bacterium]|nr:hypothetical protein [Ktedonobacterales bacterium]